MARKIALYLCGHLALFFQCCQRLDADGKMVKRAEAYYDQAENKLRSGAISLALQQSLADLVHQGAELKSSPAAPFGINITKKLGSSTIFGPKIPSSGKAVIKSVNKEAQGFFGKARLVKSRLLEP